MWGELSVARTAMIDLEVFEREPLDGFEDEVNEIVFWHSVTKIGWQEHWCFTVNINEAGAHSLFLASSLDL